MKRVARVELTGGGGAEILTIPNSSPNKSLCLKLVAKNESMSSSSSGHVHIIYSTTEGWTGIVGELGGEPREVKAFNVQQLTIKPYVINSTPKAFTISS